jgi:CubicO group peptidase (beta-lactamase class C family)
MRPQGFIAGFCIHSAPLFRCIACAIFVVFAVPMFHAQTQLHSPAQRRLDQRMPVWLNAFNVTGVGIAWIENGRVSWTAYYGLQVPGGPRASDKTLYSVASLTKPISAEIILRLASAGKISLDEPIDRYWIDPDVKDSDWNRLLTPRLCLSHQTGFPNWRYQTGNVLKFQWQPGTAFGYSGEGYEYVARFAENKTGRKWEDLAQQYVFDPIGMRDTSYSPKPWWEGRQAKPVEMASRTKSSAADLLRATVGDYAKFVISVMKSEGLTGKTRDEQFTITRNLTTPDQESVLCEAAKDARHCRVATGYGLGWHIVDLDGMKIVDHTGRDGDVMTFAFFVPSKQIGAVVFTDGPDVGHQMIDKVLKVLYADPIYAQTLWQ